MSRERKNFASWIRCGWIICLFVLVLGARWAVIERYGMDLPEWDQWDGEGVHLLAPWLQGRLRPVDLFYPHNEHRIVLTKLVNLGLAAANGQWDQRLEAVVNALFASAVACGLLRFGMSFLGGARQAVLFCLLAALYALPLAWGNVVGGFQSQQIFLIGLSFGAIAWLPCSRPGSPRWWLGAACMVLDLGTMASGFFAAAVVALLLVARRLRGAAKTASVLPGLALAVLLVAVAMATRVPVAYLDAAKAGGVGDFVKTLTWLVEWPVGFFGQGWIDFAWLGVIFWSPWWWLAFRVLVGGRKDAGEDAMTHAGYALTGLGAWVFLQFLATGYARGSGGNPPPSRYVDTLVFGAAVNALALGWLWRSRAGGRLPTALGIAWAIGLCAGSAGQLVAIFSQQLPDVGFYHTWCVRNVANYLATGDGAYLQHDEVPYPGASGTAQRLSVPGLRSLLPVSVRDPLPLKASGASSGFVRNDSRRPQDAPAPAAPPAGVSPEVSPLRNAITWGSYGSGVGVWKSEPLQAHTRGWLKIDVSGWIGEPGASLEVRDAATGNMLSEVVPDRVPGNTWRSAYVRTPGAPFILEARVSDPARWFAFDEPVEMGFYSLIARRCAKEGLALAATSAAAALLLGIAAWRLRAEGSRG